MSERPAAPVPTLVGYDILAELHRDRLGVVYRARWLLQRREVALRLVDERACGGQRDLTPILRLAQKATSISHPQLLTLLEAGENEGQLYLVSDLPEGPSVRQRLGGVPMPPDEAVKVLLGVARAVQHLHERNVLHLGLNAACIFVEAGGAPLVGDLGLTGLLHLRPSFPADPASASPEQLTGNKADVRTDVYGLGCLLHECLTGQPPFAASSDEETARLVRAGRSLSPRVANPSCPQALEQIVRKAASVRPDRRHANVLALIEDLERFQRGEVRPVAGPFARALDAVRLRPVLASLVGALVLGLTCFVVFSSLFARQSAILQAQAEELRNQAEKAASQAESARDESARVREREAEKVRIAESNLIRARGELAQQRKNAIEESKLRQRTEQQYREQAQLRARAEAQARDADEARRAAVAARDAVVDQVVRLHVGQGRALQDAGDLSGALVPFTRAWAVARRDKRPEDAHRLRLAGLLAACPRPMCLLTYKKGDLEGVHLAPDGKRLLVVGADGVVTVRSAETGKLVGKRIVHGAAVAHATLDPDGKHLLTADNAGRVRMWNVEDGTAVFDPIALDAPALHLGFSGDGQRIVTVHALPGEEGPAAEVQVRDARKGEAIGEAFTSQVAPRPPALSRDGKRLLVCCTDRSVRMYDVESGKLIGPALEQGSDVVLARFSPDGKQILTAGGDGSARVWSVATGKLVHSAPKDDLSTQPGLFDESGQLMLVVSREGNVHVRDLTTGKRAGPDLRLDSPLRQARISPDGRHVALAGIGGVVRIFDTSNGLPALPPLFHSRPLEHLALAPDGSRLLTFDGLVVRVWDLTAGEPLGLASPPVGENVTRSPDGTREARVEGTAVLVHDSRSGKAVGPPLAHKGEVYRVVFAPQGDLLLTVANPEEKATTPTWDVRVWDARTGKPLGEPMEHLREVQQARFVAGTAQVLTVALDKRVRLWEARSGKRVGKPMEHAEEIVLADLSPDGKHVVSSDATGLTRAWDATTGDRAGEAMPHARRLRFLAFAADGRSLATCCEDGSARIWVLGTGRRLGEVEHAGAVTHASFAPDGKVLLTASADGTARAWNVADARPRTPPLPHPGPVHLTAFSADGRWLLTGSGASARIWDADNGDPIGGPQVHTFGPATLTFVALSKANDLTTEVGPGTRWTRSLEGAARTVADDADLSLVLSSREASSFVSLAPASPGDLERAWDRLLVRFEADFTPPRQRLLAWSRRGAAECEARGLWAGALRHLDGLLADRVEPALYARRGKARTELGLYEGALADYARALESEAGPWDWWAGRAAAAAALRRWDRAAEDYVQATKRESRRADLWQQLAGVEAERGKWKESAEAATKAIRFGANDPATWYELALAQLAAGDLKGYRLTCARLAKKASRADPALQRALADVCGLAPEAVKDLTSILEQAEKSARSAPEESRAQVRLAALLLRKGEPGRAVALLEKWASGEQAREGDSWLLAVALERAGQKDRAKEAVAKARARKPGATWQERQAAALWKREAEGTR